jgi:pyridoxamine 5'-phosphate oxidase
MPPLPSLQQIEASIWRELAAASVDKGHGWRTAVLATRDAEGADARTVVLREVDAEARELIFFTDARSPKVAQLQAHSLGTLVLWSAPLSWQLRLRVRLTLASSGLKVSSRWARLQFTAAAQDYMAHLAPGTALTDAKVERGSREHFAVVTAQVLAVDWLALSADGHKRAAFDDGGSRWLVP